MRDSAQRQGEFSSLESREYLVEIRSMASEFLFIHTVRTKVMNYSILSSWLVLINLVHASRTRKKSGSLPKLIGTFSRLYLYIYYFWNPISLVLYVLQYSYMRIGIKKYFLKQCKRQFQNGNTLMVAVKLLLVNCLLVTRVEYILALFLVSSFRYVVLSRCVSLKRLQFLAQWWVNNAWINIQQKDSSFSINCAWVMLHKNKWIIPI